MLISLHSFAFGYATGFALFYLFSGCHLAPPVEKALQTSASGIPKLAYKTNERPIIRTTFQFKLQPGNNDREFWYAPGTNQTPTVLVKFAEPPAQIGPGMTIEGRLESFVPDLKLRPNKIPGYAVITSACSVQ